MPSVPRELPVALRYVNTARTPVAGTREPVFLENAARWAAALQGKQVEK
jgi:hypothetical protein